MCWAHYCFLCESELTMQITAFDDRKLRLPFKSCNLLYFSMKYVLNFKITDGETASQLPKLIIFKLVKWYGNRCILHDKDCVVKIKKPLETSELMAELHGSSKTDLGSHSKGCKI